MATRSSSGIAGAGERFATSAIADHVTTGTIGKATPDLPGRADGRRALRRIAIVGFAAAGVSQASPKR